WQVCHYKILAYREIGYLSNLFVYGWLFSRWDGGANGGNGDRNANGVRRTETRWTSPQRFSVRGVTIKSSGDGRRTTGAPRPQFKKLFGSSNSRPNASATPG